MNWNKIKKTGIVAILMTMTLGFASCLKDDQDDYQEMVAAVEAVNAVPGSNGIILALDNNQLNNLNMGEYFLAGQLLNYRRVYPGNRLLRAFHPENLDMNSAIFRKEVFFEPGKYYSLFVVKTPEDKIEVIQVTDELTAPAAGKASVRFINLHPSGKPLDFGIVGQETLLASNLAFKSHTVFTEYEADKEYELFVRQSGTGDEYYTFKWTPKSKDINTIWANGGLTHGIIVH
jgi:hypothetical protein